MSRKELAFYLIDVGMNARAPAERLPVGAYARATNVAIVNGLVTTRPGARVVPLSGDDTGPFAAGNVQGVLFYDPFAGQGARVLGSGRESILVAAAGRKFALDVTGDPVSATAAVVEVTNGVSGAPDVHLVWWGQWENYALAQDGTGNCWIWDGSQPAFASNGYNVTNKELSQVPNGGTAMAYVHARGSVVVNNRSILTSDSLNERDLGSAKDLLAFRDQVYWATGQYFAPPTSMGEINALAVLPVKDTAHGHGELMAHCANGIFSVELNIAPRSSWANTQMVKTAYLGPGGTGPYAVTLFDGDQLFRAGDGVKTLRSARAEAGREGSPTLPISEPVYDFFAADTPSMLRFASVAAWHAQKRAFITCYPVVQGAHRWHRGLASLNFVPQPGQMLAAAWEGLWTLPPECAGIIQQVNGRLAGDDRHFAICRGGGERNRLVEFSPKLENDVREDGTEQRVRCQLMTRRLDLTEPFDKKSFALGELHVTDVRGVVDWGVWVRSYGRPQWTLWRSGRADNLAASDTLGGDPAPSAHAITLGRVPDDNGLNTSRWVQFLIRWAGHWSIESLRVDYESNNADGIQFDAKALKRVDRKQAVTDYSDFEYSDDLESESWLSEP